jgi:putative photosynthetic complex assembly protein 2
VSAGARPTSHRALAAALVAVVGFWWAATGLTIAMQRDGATRAVSAVAATVLAAYAVKLVADARRVCTPAGATRSFAGGALLWAWVSVLLYGGWVTGLPPDPTTAAAVGSAPSAALAVHAVGATLYSDLLALALIAAMAALTWRAPNRTGLWSLVIFWAAHQTAKLNVFFGVRHAGAEFLPAGLAHLEHFFGPPRNSPLLAPTVAALALVAGALAYRAWAAHSAFRRTACALLAALTALALVEHALLGASFALPLWSTFLRARGT